MTITDPIAQVTFPQAISAAVQQLTGTQQAALLGQEAALTGQQAQQASVATQLAKARLPIILSALRSFDEPGTPGGTTPGGMPLSPTGFVPDASSPSTPAAAQAAADQSGTAPPVAGWPGNPAATDAALRERFFVNPAGTPGEIRRLVVAGLSGDPGLLAAAKYQRDLGVKTRLAESRYESSNLYDSLNTVVDATPGSALATLQAIAPGAAQQIERSAKTPQQAGELAREFAAHVAAQVHQYTGRAVSVNKAGEYRDALTGLLVPGVEKMGLSTQQVTALAQAGMAPVSVPQSNGTTRTVPKWQAMGAPSLEAFVAEQARAAGATGFQQTIAGAPRMAAQAALANAVQQAQQSATQRNGGVSVPITNADPVLTQALGDKSYRIQAQPVQFGVSATPEVIENQKLLAQSRNGLMQDGQVITRANAQALTYLRAAQLIMDGKGKMPLLGVPGSVAKWISERYNGTDASNYQEIAKNLTNAALQAAKQTYGSKMTEEEVGLQLHEASPSAKMTSQALKALIAENTRIASYNITGAGRIRQYLAAGNDPREFNNWLQQYWPMQRAIVKGGASARARRTPQSTVPAVGTVMDGYRFTGGNPASPTSWARVGGAR